MKWDLFVSHAAEDKDDLVRPIVKGLMRRGVSVWFDELALRPGDRLRETIDAGLADSRCALVVLSPAYLGKGWTRYEFDGLIQRFVSRGITLIPIWHTLSHADVMAFSPSLADVVGVRSDDGLEAIIEAVCSVVLPASHGARLVEVFRTTFKWAKGVDKACRDLLVDFSNSNPIFRLVDTPLEQEHEWGRGGWRTWEHHLIDVAGTMYFVLKFRDEWETYSDDSTDFASPSGLTVLSSLPTLSGLAEQVLSIATDEVDRQRT